MCVCGPACLATALGNQLKLENTGLSSIPENSSTVVSHNIQYSSNKELELKVGLKSNRYIMLGLSAEKINQSLWHMAFLMATHTHTHTHIHIVMIAIPHPQDIPKTFLTIFVHCMLTGISDCSTVGSW